MRSEIPLLALRGICKRFEGVVALDDVDFEIAAGEVVALAGENGAGKSTLMRILHGICQPDAGEILLDGKVTRITSARHAISLGIAFIHQELNTLDNLDIAANVCLGREPRNRLGLVHDRVMHEQTAPLIQRLGLKLSTRASVGRLSLAHKQLVEIARALSMNARVIIMDEPTSSLTVAETDRLLEIVNDLSRRGVSIIFISHRLAEIDRCAHRVVVLRDGRNAGELKHEEATHDRLIRLMIGRDIPSGPVSRRKVSVPAFLRVRNARSSMYPEHTVSFEAGAGEILGFAGLVGAGRSELMKAIAGLDVLPGAEILIEGKPVSIRTPRDAIARGICLVPENRRAEGLIPGMSVKESITLPSLGKLSRFGLIRRGAERELAREQVDALRVKASSLDAGILSLSGGNQQKVVLARWLALRPRVLILDEPTRGIDVGAKAEIYEIMNQLAANGTAVIMVSSDMEEVLLVCDRVAVMREGQITGILDRDKCSEESIMRLAVGRDISPAEAATQG